MGSLIKVNNTNTKNKKPTKQKVWGWLKVFVVLVFHFFLFGFFGPIPAFSMFLCFFGFWFKTIFFIFWFLVEKQSFSNFWGFG